MKKILLAFFCLFAIVANGQTDTTAASQPTKVYVIKTSTGGEFIGVIISQDAREVLIETKDRGKVLIPRYLILEIKELQGEKNLKGEIVQSEVFATRYFLSANGLPLKKGENYFQTNYWGLDFEFGVTKNLSVGIMSSWFLYPVVGTVKYSIPISNNAYFGIGAIAGTSTWFPEEYHFSFALPFGSLTVGNYKDNLTVSAGYGSIWSGSENNGRAMLSVAGMKKIGRKASFVFDSFILPPTNNGNYGLMAVPGVRIQTSGTKAFQIGLAAFAANGSYLPYPIPFVQWFHKI